MSIDVLLARCRESGLLASEVSVDTLAPARCLEVPPGSWLELASLAKDHGVRWSAFWVTQEPGREFEAFSCMEHGGEYLIVRTRLHGEAGLASLAGVYPAADRPERHARDLFGIRIEAAPDLRRWTRHQAWPADQFPLRDDFLPLDVQRQTPPDESYPFVAARGTGVVEIPVGPVHAGIIEPGHFRFQAVGETVLNLEQHLGYVHKGIEKLAVGRDPTALARLAARVSGDSTVAHSWAACQALERALGVEVPARAAWLRAVMCERERIANHIGDIGAICNDVGFAFPQAQLTRLKEVLVRENLRVFGHRLLMDKVVPGGVAVDPVPTDLEEMAFNARSLAHEFAQIIDRIEASESLEDRLMTTGRLAPDLAATLGCVGYVGKASGQPFDVRRDAPYAPYDRFRPGASVYRAGDVAARARVRADEVLNSLVLVAEMLESMPGGAGHRELPEVSAGEGIGIIEGWRGEIVTYVRLDGHGRVTRFYPRDPSWLSWPALELLVQDNIVPDFPVCNKSINGSYSGVDL